MADPVEAACRAYNVSWADIKNRQSVAMRATLIAALEAKADSLSAPLPGNAYPLEWQEIVQGFLREWATEMRE